MSDIMEITLYETPHSKDKKEGLCIIKNFRDLRHDHDYRDFEESSIFYTGHNDKYEWTFDILKDGYNDDYEDYVSIRFFLANEDNVDLNEQDDLRFTASIIDEDGKKFSIKPEVFNCPDIPASIFKDFVLRKDLLSNPKLLPNGELRISFEISSDASNIKPSQKNQLKIFGEIFDVAKYTDFKLIVEGKEFNVHRAILARRSPVFEAMFNTKMCENKKGKVDIVDVEAKVMEKLLRFVYAGDVNLEDVAEKMLVAADKYQIVELKQMCEDVLVERLSLTNVYDTLRFADENNTENLKKKTIEFFHRNDTKLYAAEDFKVHLNSLPGHLKTDIISAFISNKL